MSGGDALDCIAFKSSPNILSTIITRITGENIRDTYKCIFTINRYDPNNKCKVESTQHQQNLKLQKLCESRFYGRATVLDCIRFVSKKVASECIDM